MSVVRGDTSRKQIHVKTLNSTLEKVMKSKDEYIESLTSELKDWSAQIDVLTAKMANAADDVKLKYAEEVEALRAKRHTAAEKLDELQNASGDAWETIKDTADEVWDDLKTGLANFAAKFK